MLAFILAADIYLCDPHGICAQTHDYVGIGDKPWPVEKHYPGWWGHEKTQRSEATSHKPCKLGDQNWKNDCK